MSDTYVLRAHYRDGAWEGDIYEVLWQRKELPELLRVWAWNILIGGYLLLRDGP